MWNELLENSGQITYFCVTAEPPIGNTVSPTFKQIRKERDFNVKGNDKKL